jgi:hypothetical protein
LGAYLVNPTHALMAWVDPQPEATRKLLELSEQAVKVALCAHDAHGIPSYEESFRTMAMYLPAGTRLSGDPQLASDTVLSALASGNSYCVFRALGEGSGFVLDGINSERAAKAGQVLTVRWPSPAPPEARLRVTGPAHVLDGHHVSLDGPGAVQIEVWGRAPGRFFTRDWKPWLVPSPILIRG